MLVLLSLLLCTFYAHADEKPDVSKKVIYSSQNKMEFKILITITAHADGNYSVVLENTEGFGYIGHDGNITQYQYNGTEKKYEFMMRILETTESGSYNITFRVFLEGKEVHKDNVMISLKNVKGDSCIIFTFLILLGILPALSVRWRS